MVRAGAARGPDGVRPDPRVHRPPAGRRRDPPAQPRRPDHDPDRAASTRSPSSSSASSSSTTSSSSSPRTASRRSPTRRSSARPAPAACARSSRRRCSTSSSSCPRAATSPSASSPRRRSRRAGGRRSSPRPPASRTSVRRGPGARRADRLAAMPLQRLELLVGRERAVSPKREILRGRCRRRTTKSSACRARLPAQAACAGGVTGVTEIPTEHEDLIDLVRELRRGDRAPLPPRSTSRGIPVGHPRAARLHTTCSDCRSRASTGEPAPGP